MKEITIALLGQPNSGKSTLFNGLTGSKQHVGNWPGKTVEQKEGYFNRNQNKYTIVDLPGSYSLSASSDEEIITREYIASKKADLICMIIDASQLERSLFMLADFTGIKTPLLLILNMMDVAKAKGKIIDCDLISKKLGITVVPMVAADSKEYDNFYSSLEKAIATPKILDENHITHYYKESEHLKYEEIKKLIPPEGTGVYSSAWLTSKLIEKDKPALEIVKNISTAANFEKITGIAGNIKNGTLLTGEIKFKWIQSILSESVKTSVSHKNGMGKFDKVATDKIWGKPLAILIIILGLVGSMIVGFLMCGLVSILQEFITPIIRDGLTNIHTPKFIVSLISDAVLTAVSMTFMMVSFVFGISLVFGLIEEIGYMARISYVFDNAMSKLGLQGKAIMPFLISFGCNIGGVTGTRVIDSWGQKVATISLSWVIPCAATWGVLGLITTTFFGVNAPFIIIILFIVSALHMFITSKIFGNALIKDHEKNGLIMELPPYHTPRYKNLFRFVLNRMGDVVVRSLKMILSVAVIFWLLAYTKSGNIEESIIYKIGNFIEPVTMWFGLKWQLFIAFLSGAMGKEACLGIIASLFNTTGTGSGIWSAFAGTTPIDQTAIAGTMLAVISKPEALAFIFAFYFNIPCLMTVAATYQESHSLKWTLRIVGYYVLMALLFSSAAYHIGLIIL